MPSALDYMVLLKKQYKNNYIKIIEKHFGFFPFDVVDYDKKNFITKENFFYADHPIKISTNKEKWSFGLVSPQGDEYNKLLKKHGSNEDNNSFLQGIWNILTFNTKNKTMVIKKRYEHVMTNLSSYFILEGFTLNVKNSKYKDCFVELEKILTKIKNA